MTQAMKHGSIEKVNETIRYFNNCLKENRGMLVHFRKGVYIPSDERGIKVAFETEVSSAERPIKVGLGQYALYNFDRGGLPTQRMCPATFDIRDYFARSLLKRPNYAVLNLKVLSNKTDVFDAHFEVSYKGPSLSVSFPEQTNPIIERYRPSIESLQKVRAGDLCKAIDLAFRIYNEEKND